MTFTSLTTVYASLALAAATFASTYFPARTAMKLAAPAEDSGWALPEPNDDRLTMDLPFTFSKNESMAVLEFLDRFFRDHSEGWSGRFFAAESLLPIIVRQSEGTFEWIPALRTTVWLKPFDLEVNT